MNSQTNLTLGDGVLISKILIGFDGTECSQRALDFGLELADKFSASVTILNVVELPVYGIPEDPLAASAAMPSFIKDLRKAHEDVLNKAAKRTANLKPNVGVSLELREGNPPEQIVAIATERSFDVVVVGHGGEGRIRELFLGGTSERVAHLARCVVVIVK